MIKLNQSGCQPPLLNCTVWQASTRLYNLPNINSWSQLESIKPTQKSAESDKDQFTTHSVTQLLPITQKENRRYMFHPFPVSTPPSSRFEELCKFPTPQSINTSRLQNRQKSNPAATVEPHLSYSSTSSRKRKTHLHLDHLKTIRIGTTRNLNHDEQSIQSPSPSKPDRDHKSTPWSNLLKISDHRFAYQTSIGVQEQTIVSTSKKKDRIRGAKGSGLRRLSYFSWSASWRWGECGPVEGDGE